MATSKKSKPKLDENAMTTKKETDESPFFPGVGADMGTMNLVSARKPKTGPVAFNRIRDVFLDLDREFEKRLKLSKEVDYIEKGEQIIVIGDSALEMANIFKREARRPLSRGVISAGELDAQEILSHLVFKLLGEPAIENEHCYYSVPAAPIDDPSQDIEYHTQVFKKIISEHGYHPHHANEGMAIVYSECAETDFSGLAVSFGSGMANIALAYKAIQGMGFSVARGGDFIDAHAAKAVGKTASQMCAIKERGVDLVKPVGREQEAIVLYVRALIQYVLENIAAQFKKVEASVDLPNPVPFIISGGTSLAGGFLDVFKQEFTDIQKKGFPIPISEVRAAKDPLQSVANGLLVLAGQEYT
jgi:actin-like ATPase involved in cell morphogenesis